MRGGVLFALVALFMALAPARAGPVDVDLALVLAIDISASIDDREHRLQMAGLAAALQSKAVRDAIAAAPNKRIALAVTQWSGLHVQRIVLPWTIIDGDLSAAVFARRVLTVPRADPGGGTSISLALEHAAKLFATAPPATRQVIDVSTDGINNIGPPVDRIRRQISEQGITVNGLAISNEWARLTTYLDDHVITGTAAFSIEATSFQDFGDAMQSKLLREIRGPGLS